ncbi:hypothetical protein B7494_g6138 [Chlorociboria aeruginascens]|nr:hypothetical protein B7494_g6138 [Chlorociboria aeruginascens]
MPSGCARRGAPSADQLADGGLQSYGGYDGPNDPPPQQSTPFGPSLGYDPAKPAGKMTRITNTRVELPAVAYSYEFSSHLPNRPAINTSGKPVNIRVNQFKVTKWPSQDVYQYDINAGAADAKKGLIKVIWESRALQTKLKEISPCWLWDGNKIAWSSKPMPRGEIRTRINLDVEKGRQVDPNQPDRNTHLVVVKHSKTIRMAVIQGYLSKQMAFDDSVLEAINFLDHLMRQWPSELYTVQKRNFFSRGTQTQRVPLDKVIEAMKGVYSSVRLCDPKPSAGGSGTGLAINVDVANGTFWTSQDVHQAARNFCNARNRGLDWGIFRDQLKPMQGNNNRAKKSEMFKHMEKMVKLKFTVKYGPKNDDKKIYTIKRFHFDDHAGPQGVHAKNYTFTPKTGPSANRAISIFDYFLQKYNVRLQFWDFPLIETERAGTFPMEVCTLIPNQKYQYKLDPSQTAAMIKFAVTRPAQRMEAIRHGVGMLKWHEDPYYKHFGVQVDPNMTVTQARLLQNPEVNFKGAKVNPGIMGRWDLRGKKFLLSNPQPLQSWGFCVIGECINEQTLKNFIHVFVQTYVGHGGSVTTKSPTIYFHPKGDADLGEAVKIMRLKTGNECHSTPQILFYVLPGRDSFMYERLKKNNECRFGMVSQMMNVAHVERAQPQYCSNVCADVSHASPGSPQGSMAAITMSMDKDACRYAAAVQTNGHRVEMITDSNIKSMMMPMFNQWVKKVNRGVGPKHVYYFRDGVSEGQFQHVLDQEVADMKKAVIETYGPVAEQIRWTVTICSKRHHIRFFPKEGDSTAGDRNGNAFPGTLVERDVTHPFENDFYLSSHSAIQGTARPVHYQVILDEAQCNVNEFHRMVYQHCYQYMRSTTPVSLYPAVYYAHLASNRARAHESAATSDGPRGGQKFVEGQQDNVIYGKSVGRSSETGSGNPTEARPLIPLGNPEDQQSLSIRGAMWYI